MAAGQKTLWIWSTLPKRGLVAEDQNWRKEGDSVENVNRIQMGGHSTSTFEAIRSGVHFPYTVQHTIELLGVLVPLGKPGAEVQVCQVVAENEETKGNLKTQGQFYNLLKLSGLINLGTPEEIIVDSDEAKAEIREALQLSPECAFKVVKVSCRIPDFEAGSSRKLSFASKVEAAKVDPTPKEKIWNLDLEDDDVELVNQDDLLDQDDYIKPDPASLKVCGTTGQRKACKDCSCGLREELESESGKLITPKSVTSSCGSCYLGDAFRCASCPYLGMPAFKPGEKVQLSNRQLNPDK